MGVEPGLATAAAIFVLSPAGNRNQHRTLSTRPLTHSSRDLVAIHARHSDVEKHRIGFEGFAQGQRRGTVVRDSHLAAEQRQDFGKPKAMVRMSSTTRSR